MEVQNVDEVAKKIYELKQKKDELNEELKEIELKIERYTQNFISTLTDLGKTSWELDGIGKIGIASRRFYTIKDQTKIQNYLKENGFEDLIKVNAMSITGLFNNEILRDNENIIKESLEAQYGVSFYDKPYISIRRSK